MSDHFAQTVQGLHKVGDTPTTNDQHIAVLAKDSAGNYQLLSLDDAGKLQVTGGTEYNRDDVAGATDAGRLVLVVRDDALTTLTESDGDYTVLRTNELGALWTTISGDVNVTATDLDIRDLNATQDNVAISDGTNTLAINADGSINVISNDQAQDSVYVYGSANLVKDTPTTVASVSPTTDEYYSGIMVSGAGYCEWAIKYGDTNSEQVIVQFWTTPSSPSFWFDMPDYLKVGNGKSLIVEATNREKKPSPFSDFTGHVSIIRKV